MDELSRVTIKRIQDIVNKVTKEAGTDDVEVGMEFLISAFFPDAYSNLREQMSQEYIRGYNDGRNSLAEDDGK